MREYGLKTLLPLALLLLLSPARGAYADSVRVDTSAAAKAVQEQCARAEQTGQYGGKNAQACADGLAKMRSLVKIEGKSYYSQKRCLEVQNEFLDGAPALLSEQAAWCSAEYPELSVRRNCINAGGLFLQEVADYGFCPGAEQIRATSQERAYLIPPAKSTFRPESESYTPVQLPAPLPEQSPEGVTNRDRQQNPERVKTPPPPQRAAEQTGYSPKYREPDQLFDSPKPGRQPAPVEKARPSSAKPVQTKTGPAQTGVQKSDAVTTAAERAGQEKPDGQRAGDRPEKLPETAAPVKRTEQTTPAAQENASPALQLDIPGLTRPGNSTLVPGDSGVPDNSGGSVRSNGSSTINESNTTNGSAPTNDTGSPETAGAQTQSAPEAAAQEAPLPFPAISEPFTRNAPAEADEPTQVPPGQPGAGAGADSGVTLDTEADAAASAPETQIAKTAAPAEQPADAAAEPEQAANGPSTADQPNSGSPSSEQAAEQTAGQPLVPQAASAQNMTRQMADQQTDAPVPRALDLNALANIAAGNRLSAGNATEQTPSNRTDEDVNAGQDEAAAAARFGADEFAGGAMQQTFGGPAGTPGTGRGAARQPETAAAEENASGTRNTPPIGRVVSSPVISSAPPEPAYMGDEDTEAAVNFNPARTLGVRNENIAPFQRFEGAIPNFTGESPAASTSQNPEQPSAFTVNRGPAAQQAN